MDPGPQAEATSSIIFYPLPRRMQGLPETYLLRTASRLEDYSGSVSAPSPSDPHVGNDRASPADPRGSRPIRCSGRRAPAARSREEGDHISKEIVRRHLKQRSLPLDRRQVGGTADQRAKDDPRVFGVTADAADNAVGPLRREAKQRALRVSTPADYVSDSLGIGLKVPRFSQ